MGMRRVVVKNSQKHPFSLLILLFFCNFAPVKITGDNPTKSSGR